MNGIGSAALAIQTVTFFILGLAFYADGDWRRGTAQVLLGAITVLIYA